MAVFDFDHPWVVALGILGNLISILVYLSPLPTFIRIFKEKSTLGFQSLPYMVALFSAMLWLYYALLKDAILLISINSLGCVIETIYIFIYLLYASKEPKKQTTKLFAALNVGTFCGVFLVAHFAFDGKKRIEVVGWVCVAVSTIVFASPLSIVFQVVRTRSVEFMPFALSLTLTVSAVIWFTYGILQKDICVAVPNVFGFILGILQMILYGLYRNPKPVMEEKKPDQQSHGVIDIVILPAGSDQVHPLDLQPCSSDEDSDKTPEKCPESLEMEHCSPPAKFHIESPGPVLIVCAT